MIRLIPDLLYEAIDRNMVVFDSEANVGEPTKRLIALMRRVSKSNNIGILYSFLVDNKDFDKWNDIVKKNILNNNILSINNYDELLDKYYTKHEASLAVGDIKFIIGVTKDEKSILGSY
jgi:hypothetical protein